VALLGPTGYETLTRIIKSIAILGGVLRNPDQIRQAVKRQLTYSRLELTAREQRIGSWAILTSLVTAPLETTMACLPEEALTQHTLQFIKGASSLINRPNRVDNIGGLGFFELTPTFIGIGSKPQLSRQLVEFMVVSQTIANPLERLNVIAEAYLSVAIANMSGLMQTPSHLNRSLTSVEKILISLGAPGFFGSIFPQAIRLGDMLQETQIANPV